MERVFISYSTKETSAAEKVCAYLEENNIPCWMAPRNISPGASYASQIVGAIHDCSMMVVLASQAANASGHVCNEVSVAFDEKKIIIPFRLDDALFHDDFQYFFGTKQWIDGSTDFSAALFSLKQTVLDPIPGHDSEPAPAPKQEPKPQPQPEYAPQPKPTYEPKPQSRPNHETQSTPQSQPDSSGWMPRHPVLWLFTPRSYPGKPWLSICSTWGAIHRWAGVALLLYFLIDLLTFGSFHYTAAEAIGMLIFFALPLIVGCVIQCLTDRLVMPPRKRTAFLWIFSAGRYPRQSSLTALSCIGVALRYVFFLVLFENLFMRETVSFSCVLLGILGFGIQVLCDRLHRQ
ncbi:MAG: TIR domain-containing protein [Oscillospiraceae bacterium]|nr:TIR domain-containing protein [Oscillospiraceae bacterium]